MTDNLEKMTRDELWNELASKYSELFNYKTDFVTRYPRSKSECIKLVEFLRLQLTIIESSKTKVISFTGIAKRSANNPTKLIFFALFKLSIDWLKCYICCLAESLIDHLNGNTGGWNDRQLLLPSHHNYKKVSLREEMEIWHKYQDFELTQDDQPIFQRIIQAV